METVDVTGVAAGGDGVGRLPDGRAVFVRGALPGERVVVDVFEEKPRFARAAIVEVLEAGPGRVDPPPPEVVAGCGGCDWLHVELGTQRRLKAQIVADALQRLGRLPSIPEIDLGPELPATGYRTTVRAAVDPALGIAGFRAHHSHDVIPIDPSTGSLVAHPLVDDVLRRGRFHACTEITVRAGVATGERLLLADPGWGAIDDVPDDVTMVGTGELGLGRRAWYHEVVAGRRWRISAESFFQIRPDGAEALVDAVAAALAPVHDADPIRHLVDLYAGVGLFAGALADRLGPLPVTAVEASRSSIADARVNLADHAGTRVIQADVRKWHPSPADAVVADPSRHGLGAGVVDRIAATAARAVVLVSCDPGALGRDAGLLAKAGYGLESVRLVDLFPQTTHVEAVTAWTNHPKALPAP
ncbi:MAG: class I SAM-dependent RNA methyltransferase [Acidimicrobiia bacterium]|nr:class I SAM-dependent RNA methyltransferase [Acidimicrobiia bacterium]